ncbi:MAG TPA: ABC transporter permease [Anaeromyxobacteraceae bacterium]|jgi:putative ABC transport system permease protein|nr:ABC transporter permease [Anaeromyxobacteraceae bacterium]
MTSLLDTVSMALATLRANPLRSALTLLGIVIGASTVVAMMSLTEGLRLKVTSDLAFLGAGSFQISKWPAIQNDDSWQKYARRRDITRQMGESLRGLPHVAHVSVEAWSEWPDRVWTRDRSTQPNVWIVGGEQDYERANAISVAQGRFLTGVDAELGRHAAFIGPDVADLLFPGEPAVGKEIRIRSTPFTVVGVAERRGSVFGIESKDAFAVISLDDFNQVMGRARNFWITVAAPTPDVVGQAIDEVVAQMRQARGLRGREENDFEVYTNDSVSETFDNILKVVAAATFGVCALALLVGGIGIMNIMLVSVSERTREIGVRMALGARRRRILSQFMVESTVLSGLGGVLGVLAGAGLAIAAREVYGVPASIPAWAVVLSLVSASGCGLLFGIYPAARASRLDPVEAMRTE